MAGVTRYHIKANGKVSGIGKYGTEGDYDRELKLNNIIEIKRICGDEPYF